MKNFFKILTENIWRNENKFVIFAPALALKRAKEFRKKERSLTRFNIH